MSKQILTACVIAATYFLSTTTVDAQVVRVNANSYRPALVRPVPAPLPVVRVATPVYNPYVYPSVYDSTFNTYPNYGYSNFYPSYNYVTPSYYPSVYPSYNYVTPSYYPSRFSFNGYYGY